MLVKAKKIFSNGIVKMVPGDKANLKDDLAKQLILLGVVEEVPSHKKMKFKAKIKPIEEDTKED